MTIFEHWMHVGENENKSKSSPINLLIELCIQLQAYYQIVYTTWKTGLFWPKVSSAFILNTGKFKILIHIDIKILAF